jgi:hypothetical protein
MSRLGCLIPGLLLVLAACGDGTSTEPVVETMTGVWVGSAGIAGITVQLTEVNGVVSGAGTFTHGTDAYPVQVSGTHTYPSVDLRVLVEGQQEMQFTGAFQGADAVAGTLQVPGIGPVPLTIRRQ